MKTTLFFKFNDLITEPVPIGFQQFICLNNYQPLSPDESEIISSNLDFLVYIKADKEIFPVPVLRDDQLYGCVYIEKIK